MAQEDGLGLIGQNWLVQIRLLKSIFSIKGTQLLDDLLSQYSSVFRDELYRYHQRCKSEVLCKGELYSLVLQASYYSAALRKKVSNELYQLTIGIANHSCQAFCLQSQLYLLKERW